MDQSVDELIEQLVGTTVSEQPEVINKLLDMDANVVELLITRVKRNHGRYSWLAAKALSRIDDSRVVPAFITILPELDYVLKGMVIELLSKLGDKEIILPLLIENLNTQEDFVQTTVVQALRKIGDKSAVGPLLTALDLTTSPSVRYSIIEVLGDLGDPRAIKPISKYKDDENHHVRRRVTLALEKLKLKD